MNLIHQSHTAGLQGRGPAQAEPEAGGAECPENLRAARRKGGHGCAHIPEERTRECNSLGDRGHEKECK